MRSKYRLGIDAGGTFTDFVLADETGNVRLYKVLSTPSDPTRAIRDGLQLIADDLGESVPDSLRSRWVKTMGRPSPTSNPHDFQLLTYNCFTVPNPR